SASCPKVPRGSWHAGRWQRNRICHAKSLAHYEALVEAGGLAALRLRDDYMHAVVRGIVMRECRERIGVLPSAREVLPDLEPPPNTCFARQSTPR
ncbi:MAG: hypothetical protein IKO43_03010, partial [Kiritimatiellae bacterium]|nr:hypothetical protein [Kiritimatiellia bacterium]